MRGFLALFAALLLLILWLTFEKTAAQSQHEADKRRFLDTFASSAPDEPAAAPPPPPPLSLPLIRSGDQLLVERDPATHRRRFTSLLDRSSSGKWQLRFPCSVKSVVFDIGTNLNPETWPVYHNRPDTAMIWFEPVSSLQDAAIAHAAKEFRGVVAPRIVPINAAVGPSPGHTKFNIAAESGCNSLLAMNEDAQKDATVRKSPKFVSNCVTRSETVVVPLVRGDDIVQLVPEGMPMPYLGIDGQGFDLHIASSFGAAFELFDVIMLECQDLAPGDPKLIVKGAFTCADVVRCMRSMAPRHELVNLKGDPMNWCSFNNIALREFNCIFRRRGAKMLQVPTGGGGDRMKAAATAAECPSMERSTQLSTLAP